MKLFKNQAGFSDVITIIILGGVIGSIFILGVFVSKEAELASVTSRAEIAINELVAIYDSQNNNDSEDFGSQNTETKDCLPEQREADICIEIYQPVCASVRVECVTTPCPPVKETFPNSCFACSNDRVIDYTEGACE